MIASLRRAIRVKNVKRILNISSLSKHLNALFEIFQIYYTNVEYNSIEKCGGTQTKESIPDKIKAVIKSALPSLMILPSSDSC